MLSMSWGYQKVGLGDVTNMTWTEYISKYCRSEMPPSYTSEFQYFGIYKSEDSLLA